MPAQTMTIPSDEPVCGQRWDDKTCILSPPGHAGDHLAVVEHKDREPTVTRWGPDSLKRYGG